MQDKEGKSHCKSYKNQWDFQLDKLFSLFIMIFGFNKRYLEKNEYFCNRKKNNIRNGLRKIVCQDSKIESLRLG